MAKYLKEELLRLVGAFCDTRLEFASEDRFAESAAIGRLNDARKTLKEFEDRFECRWKSGFFIVLTPAV